jgi:sensor domain CHASE-containing protein
VRKRVLIVACLVALLLTAGVFYGAREVLFRGFSTIENEQATLNIERVRRALQTDIDQLSTTTADYVLWNDASNFGRETLDTLRVQLVWTTDIEGHTVVALTSKAAPPGVLTTIQPDVMGALRSTAPRLVSTGSTPGLHLIRLPDGVLAFATLRAVRTDRPDSVAGTLLLGRYLDDALVARLAETSQSPVRLTLLDEKGKPTTAVSRKVADWLGARSLSDVLI